MSPSDFAHDLIAALRDANHIAVLTGAGVSAESGIPTFRQAQVGLWAQYDPQELATPAAFRRNPGLVWRWYQWRRQLVAKAAPNPAHVALAQMQLLAPQLTLITQNVDNLHQQALHQQAGSEQLLELHGNLARNKCFENNHPVAPRDELEPAASDLPPRCPHCQSLLRPDVVWFGEALPDAMLQKAYDAAASCDLFIAVGTSALVHPAAGLPLVALDSGATLVEVNPETTPLSTHAHHLLRGAAGEILPQLIQAIWPDAAAQSSRGR